VSIKVLEIDWLANKLPDLFIYLGKFSEDSIFGNEFIKLLLEQQ
jgi:hypothetical protein